MCGRGEYRPHIIFSPTLPSTNLQNVHSISIHCVLGAGLERGIYRDPSGPKESPLKRNPNIILQDMFAMDLAG